LRNAIKFKHLNRELPIGVKMPFVDLLRFKNNSTDYMSQKMWEKVNISGIKGKIFRKNQLKKNPKIP
jgi:hypothetical protein